MTIPRQPPSSSGTGGGRVNQKQRTRQAIVDAAIELIDEGSAPTVAAGRRGCARVAHHRLPLLPHAGVAPARGRAARDVDDLEALVAEPVDADHAAERALDVLHRFNERVLDEEVRYRNAMRVYQELWFNASGAGDPAPIVREGRRARWFRTLLAPLRDQLGDDAVERLVLGLCVLGGMEAMTALRDVCRLSPGEALAVTDWAARALVAATLGDLNSPA